jgi:hypothetical protein
VSHWLALSITSQSTSRCLRLPFTGLVPQTTLTFSNLFLVFRIAASSPAV